MKVVKFGGVALQFSEGVERIRQIVENYSRDDCVVVVVSAVTGMTDKLISTAECALLGDDRWVAMWQSMRDDHAKLSDGKAVANAIDEMFDQLRSIYVGVSYVRDLSNKTLNTIASYGERMSALIVADSLPTARLYDSREFIKTENSDGKVQLDSELSYRLVREAFSDCERISVVPGFIASDRDSGETTTLGRGGADYTASVVAAALGASELEIWTDVDGFTTADRQIIESAYTIPQLSYIEAMEMSNFGAKVIYPPAIYPVCVKDIPIRVRNFFNVENEGSVVRRDAVGDTKPIRGISSITGTTLITVAGLSMVGVEGVNRRIFATLAEHGVSVFMVAQASSENSTSIGVSDKDADVAVDVLNREYQEEIATGAMFPVEAHRGLATIAIVGENMRHVPGIAGKLFGTLGRSGVSIIACAQGAAETNISVVLESRYLRKAVGVIHDSFFLSEYKVLNVFVCGVGTVGGKLIEQILSQRDTLKEQNRLKMNVVGIANSRHALFDAEGISTELLSSPSTTLEGAPEATPASISETIVAMNMYNSVFVDCTASSEVAAVYQHLIDHNVSVVTANKIFASGPYDEYLRLKQSATLRGVKFLYETNVGAGLPVIGTINDLVNSGDCILRIEAVLSGTLNYIFCNVARGVPFSEAVRRAHDEGYSEPDPRVDLSCGDVVRKIVILARECGYRLEQDEVKVEELLPDDIFRGSIDEFWNNVGRLDEHFLAQSRRLQAEGKRLQVVATVDRGEAAVELKTIAESHPFATLEGSGNAILLTTERYRHFPMLIQGYGAGADVTAAGVFANIMSVANI